MADTGQESKATKAVVVRSFLTTLVVLATVVGALALWELRVLVALLFLGFIVSAAMRPGVDALAARRVPRAAGVLLHYAAFALLLGLVEQCVEPREPQDDADGEGQRDDPADPVALELPHVQHERGRDAERDGVGERVQLGAHLAGGVEQPRDAPVERVQDRGGADHAERGAELAVERELHRGQTRRQRQDRDDAGQQAYRLGSAAALAFRFGGGQRGVHGS